MNLNGLSRQFVEAQERRLTKEIDVRVAARKMIRALLAQKHPDPNTLSRSHDILAVMGLEEWSDDDEGMILLEPVGDNKGAMILPFSVVEGGKEDEP